MFLSGVNKSIFSTMTQFSDIRNIQTSVTKVFPTSYFPFPILVPGSKKKKKNKAKQNKIPQEYLTILVFSLKAFCQGLVCSHCHYLSPDCSLETLGKSRVSGLVVAKKKIKKLQSINMIWALSSCCLIGLQWSEGYGTQSIPTPFQFLEQLFE